MNIEQINKFNFFAKLFPLWQVYLFLFYFFGGGNWRQAEAWIVILARAAEVNAHAQGALRQFTHWPWIEHPTFQLGGGHFTTKLLPPHVYCDKFIVL